jgi:hypothetical protein
VAAEKVEKLGSGFAAQRPGRAKLTSMDRLLGVWLSRNLVFAIENDPHLDAAPFHFYRARHEIVSAFV